MESVALLERAATTATAAPGRGRIAGRGGAAADRPEGADIAAVGGRPGARAARTHPARRRPAGAGRFAAQATVGAGTAAAAPRRPRRPADRRGDRCARRCSPRSHTTCAPRSPPPRPPSAPALADVDSRPRTAPNCSATPTSPWTGSPGLVENLLDMSRLQAGALTCSRPGRLDEVVPRALDDVGRGGPRGDVDIPTTLPEVAGRRGLLERVVANLVGNAVTTARRHAARWPAARSATGWRCGSIDRGPGHPGGGPGPRLPTVPAPRRPDNTDRGGPRPGLARGLAEAMGGTLVPEDTPGGGLTMVSPCRRRR